MADVAPTFEGEPEAMSVARAASLLGLPESEVRRRIAAGEFPVVAVGARLMVMAPSLRRWAETSGRQHRAQVALAAQGHPLHDPATPAPAQGTPCPTCHSPLVPVTTYVSSRYGRVAVCPHSPDYYAVDLARPLRVYDLVPDTRVDPSAA
jgi:hypothetical protein